MVGNRILEFAGWGFTTVAEGVFETDSSFHVRWRTGGGAQFLFFRSVLLALTKFSFCEEDWALGYNSMKFLDFLDIF